MLQDPKQFSLALKQICEEKGLSEKQVIETIESALAAAYRKDYGNKMQNIKTKFNIQDGSVKIYDVKTVAEDAPLEEELDSAEDKKDEKRKTDLPPKKKKDNDSADDGLEDEKKRFNPRTEIQVSDAVKIKKDAKIGEDIITELESPDDYGRMAAQTAKQVIIQKLREAERDTLYEEIKHKEDTVMSGVIQRYDPRFVLVSIGKATAILPPEHQIKNEKYNIGEQMRFYIMSVDQGRKGPEIILSRQREEIVKELFSLEIPEISSGTVEIKAIAREAGERSKVAVSTDDETIDPIGSCIGQRGNRIQTIIGELNGEKIDVIEYSKKSEKFIGNSLSPAKIVSLKIDEDKKIAVVKVKTDQFSLAIGKSGQNVRLASKLTGWKIDIQEEKSEKQDNDAAEEKKEEDKKDNKEKSDEIKEKTSGEKKEKAGDKKEDDSVKAKIKDKKEKKKEETDNKEKVDSVKPKTKSKKEKTDA
ncbi:transcription termination/antitermination protein NusA [Candidatus Parcubacteria bacterium]|nr:transcription termination/antitermination protein NusA [Candidatus Parcubacteria bacterium]